MNKSIKNFGPKNIFLFLILFVFLFLLSCQFLQAAEKKIEFAPQIKIPGFGDIVTIGEGTLASYISKFYQWSVIAIAILAVVMIMISGLRWIFAAGNPPAVKSAQDQLFAALIGLVLILICIPLLQLINPALTKLSAFKIKEISEIKEGIDIDLEDLLSPPDEWFDVDKEPIPGAKSCGTEQLYADSTYYGVVCDTRLGYRNICYMPFEIDSTDLLAWNAGEVEDLTDLLYPTEKRGKGQGCVPVAPGNWVDIPAAGGGDISVGFDGAYACGEVKPGGRYIGTKCESAGETCVISVIWEVDITGNETGKSVWQGLCLPVAVNKTCPAYEMRVSCLPNCGVPPPPKCMDVPVEDLLETDQICCKDSSGISHLR